MAAPGPGQYLGTESNWDKRQRVRSRRVGPGTARTAPTPSPSRPSAGGDGAAGGTHPHHHHHHHASYAVGAGGGIAFDSTSTRFDPRAQGGGGRGATATDGVGPGSYDHCGLADDVGKRLTSRTGAFGTSTRRFASAPGEATRLAMPGPGEYNNDDFGASPSASTLATAPGGGASDYASSAKQATVSDAQRRVRGPALSTYRNMPRPKPSRGVGAVKASSSFASDTARTSLADTRRDQDTVPPPGAYNLKAEWRAARGVAKLGSGPLVRFTEATSMTTPNIGPGAYSMPTTIKPGKPGRKNLMLSSAPRFGAGGFVPGADAAEIPGPGAYDYEMPHGNLLKPTYNVAIAEQCREIVF